jgi:hypothetical protein
MKTSQPNRVRVVLSKAEKIEKLVGKCTLDDIAQLCTLLVAKRRTYAIAIAASIQDSCSAPQESPLANGDGERVARIGSVEFPINLSAKK